MISEKLMKIQTELKAPKNLWNSYGGYKYRNAEGICEAVKPFLLRENLVLTLNDEIVAIGNRVYVKAIARLEDTDGTSISVCAFAREAESKKGMDDSQITGTASSYARKYALNGLFLLDDTKDADSDEYAKQTKAKEEEAEAEKHFEEVAKEKIPETHIKALVEKCKKDNVSVDFICQAYKVDKFGDLTNAQYRNICDKWKAIKEKANGEQSKA